ncbi:hypothetical protein BGZ75_008472 [Mortierella antarctica]|nr:hypothetical protein BGZ75_008472 [Mortierella antarctica]
MLSATNCREAQITQFILALSSVLHLLVALYTVWLIIQRNGGGGNKKIFTDLFTCAGIRIQPKPVRVLISSNTGATMYIVGLLYTIPITKHVGRRAIWEPERTNGCYSHEPIHFLYPGPFQNNLFLIMVPVAILILGVGPAFASALLYDGGDYETSRVWLTVHHANWSVMFAAMGVLFLSSGIKFIRILRINIIIAETRLGKPRTRFGVNDLISNSPARYLYVMQQITIFGGFSAMVLASLFLCSYVIFRDTLLETKLGLFNHGYAIAWTCSVPVIALVKVLLLHVQLIRNRRMKTFFTGLNWEVDAADDSQSLGAYFNPVRYPTRGSGGGHNDRDQDMEDMITDSAIESVAYRVPVTLAHTVISLPTKCRTPINIRRYSSLEQCLMRDYPWYFTSDSTTALPPDSRRTSAELPDYQQQQQPARSLSATTQRSIRDRLPPQPLEVDNRQGSDLKASPSVVYGSPQQAFRHLGIFRR